MPATEAGMQEQLKEVDAIAANAEKATFDNTVIALERTGRLLDRAQPIMRKEYADDSWRSAWVDNTRGACLLRQNNLGAATPLIRASSPIVLKRWPAGSLYGYDAERRLRAISGPASE